MNLAYNHALTQGTRIDSYEVQDVLGVGGFGITYRAHDHTLNQTVAIKEYLPDGLAYRLPDGQTLRHRTESDVQNYSYGLDRFLDEARTLARFRDPSIVRVIRFIEANGTAYLVMDFERGESLAQRLRVRGVLPEDEIRAIIAPLLQGLRSVHSENYLHRDVKPANVLLRRDGPPVLLDFGAARQALGEQTRALTAMVTPGYAPFEQYHSKDRQGPWTDLYSVGATLYHCMTGQAPAAATERVAAVYDGDADPVAGILAKAAGNYSSELVQTVIWLLQPHAKDRPQSTEEVLGHLRVPIPAAPPAPGGNGAPDPAAAAAPAVTPDVLKTVHASLEPHIGPMAEALVRKAGQRAANVDELTQLLARFIPSEEDKTQFLGKTRSLNTQQLAQARGRPRAADRAGPGQPVTAPPSTGRPGRAAPLQTGSIATSIPEVVSEQIIQQCKEKLADYVGPIAGMLVRKAAKRAETRNDYFRRLSEEIADAGQRAEFLRWAAQLAG